MQWWVHKVLRLSVWRWWWPHETEFRTKDDGWEYMVLNATINMFGLAQWHRHYSIASWIVCHRCNLSVCYCIGPSWTEEEVRNSGDIIIFQQSPIYIIHNFIWTWTRWEFYAGCTRSPAQVIIILSFRLQFVQQVKPTLKNNCTMCTHAVALIPLSRSHFHFVFFGKWIIRPMSHILFVSTQFYSLFAWHLSLPLRVCRFIWFRLLWALSLAYSQSRASQFDVCIARSTVTAHMRASARVYLMDERSRCVQCWVPTECIYVQHDLTIRTLQPHQNNNNDD